MNPAAYRMIGKNLRLNFYIKSLGKKLNYSTIDAIDTFSYLGRHLNKGDTIIPRFPQNLHNDFTNNDGYIRTYKTDLSKLSGVELDNILLELEYQNKDKEVIQFIKECVENKITIGKDVIKKLFRVYSTRAKVELVELLQKYCSRITPVLYKKNGEFVHYVAKAQCMKGNSDKGLSILLDAYKKNVNLRGFYRIILKELIQDTVMNRSEASLVIFKRYVLEFSNKWQENYPLICLWHICWKSDWFSDQMLADELLETSKTLQSILADMSPTLCLSILKEYNEDAVTRLMQSLLKYKMMDQYANVIQILFNFKLRNKDVRGCTEILRNCEVLGVSIPSYQQSQFIKLMIGKECDKTIPTKVEDFKFKF
ncbi:uncharacterized protein LOC125062034 [Pieris napi]|uniref:uncharacterized protein LOC125062034 n=1 Tax=Pieris napi TaxID=78633 RepID=UPI001FB90BA2|nr:uncharacterized protein LOC125062034 [Pieris napi]